MVPRGIGLFMFYVVVFYVFAMTTGGNSVANIQSSANVAEAKKYFSIIYIVLFCATLRTWFVCSHQTGRLPRTAARTGSARVLNAVGWFIFYFVVFILFALGTGGCDGDWLVFTNPPADYLKKFFAHVYFVFLAAVLRTWYVCQTAV